MTRSAVAVVPALVLALVASACTQAPAREAGVRLRRPAAVAVFAGRTLQDPTAIRPYLAVANEPRNDVSIVDPVTNEPVAAPIKLQSLVLPVERPALLAAAPLGDGEADLLVAVSAGDSVLQVVETWNTANVVHSDPLAPDPRLAVDLGHDVLALAPVPSDAGTARIAAVLAGRRLAVVEYARGADERSIALVSSTVTAPLGFQGEAIAAMPDDPLVDGVQTALYVATRDALAPGVFGVAEVEADLSNAAAPRALGARAPTRLVAAARLRERIPASAASDASAFEPAAVPRVYAVLDESACGETERIDCGIVSLDPSDTTPEEAIPPDYAGLMPYRAPMQVPGRPLALAISAPPAVAPADLPAAFEGLMRLYLGSGAAAIPRATTGVAAVPTDTGFVYFLDLGRFETVSTIPIVASRGNGVTLPDLLAPYTAPGTPAAVRRRLWVQEPLIPGSTNPVLDGSFAKTTNEIRYAVETTPGFTTGERYTLTWQGTLGPELTARFAEVGIDPVTSEPWLAMQVGQDTAGGSRAFSQVVRLWHPALGVRAGDLLVVKASGVNDPACVGTAPEPAPGNEPAANPTLEFEVEIGALLPPSPEYPGGAVGLVPPDAIAHPEWAACYDALTAAAPVEGLEVTLRASGLVLIGASSGYAGRPELGEPPVGTEPPVLRPFALEYPQGENEDQLAQACPLADWDGFYPPPPGVPDRDACERLVLARKARRTQNVSVDCATDPDDQAACEAAGTDDPRVDRRWPPGEYPFPIANGPALAFQVAVETETGERGQAALPVRGLELVFEPASNVVPLLANPTGVTSAHASGATAFDRSPYDPAASYRFYVSYPADFVLDTTPSVPSPLPADVIR